MRRILFAGSSEFSMPVLRMLAKEKAVKAVLSMPDRRRGRGLKVQKNCVAHFAVQHGIPLFQPERLGSEVYTTFKKHSLDLFICASYGKIFGPKFLAMFRDAAINVHPSLLPRFRGAAPIPASILAGDEYTGVTLQKIAKEMDCGDIISQTRMKILQGETLQSLSFRLAEQSAQDVRHLLVHFDAMYAAAKPQRDEEAVYSRKITSHYGYLSWMENAQQASRIARAFVSPYGGCKALYGKEIIKLWDIVVFNVQENKHPSGVVLGSDAQCGILIQMAKGIVGCSHLQRPGRKKLHWKEFLSGEPDFIGTRLR